MEITTLYDNFSFSEDFLSGFGFSALVERKGKTILFDSGGDSSTLLHNMERAGKEPKEVDLLFLSHDHGDHTGGALGFLERASHPKIFLLPSFSQSFKGRLKGLGELVEVEGTTEIADSIFSTGGMAGPPAEHSLFFSSRKGVVVLTGCAHPGIVEIVKRAKRVAEQGIFLVMGGFHLSGQAEKNLRRVVRSFKGLGVEKVSPSHCTGQASVSIFRGEYGQDFIPNGAGKAIQI